jgi:hypothetical protein
MSSATIPYLEDYVQGSSTRINYKFHELLADAYAKQMRSQRLAAIEAISSRLRGLTELESGWDSYKAPAPTVAAADAARRALELAQSELVLSASVTPSAEGGVALCWDASALHAFIEFLNDGAIITAIYQERTEPTVWDTPSDDASLKRSFAAIFSFMQTPAFAAA